jgi:hypothetical protein
MGVTRTTASLASVTFWTYMREVLGSLLGQNIGYLD